MLNTNEKAGCKSAFLLAYVLYYCLFTYYVLRCCLLLDQFDIIVPLWRGVRVV